MEKKSEDGVQRRTKTSSISLNIPAAGLGNRPPSVVSTSTLDEGGFNEPYPEIKAKLKPHSNDMCDVSSIKSEEESIPILKQEEIVVKKQDSVEPVYAVPHKPHSLIQQKSTTSTDSAASNQKSLTSTDSEASQVTVIQQKSVDSDIMYNNIPSYITNSVLSQLESQESYDKTCEEFLEHERQFENKNSELVKQTKTDSEISDINSTLSNNLIIKNSQEEIRSEASILDLNDVEYADASDEEDVIDCERKELIADAMTPAEAENLLSTK